MGFFGLRVSRWQGDRSPRPISRSHDLDSLAPINLATIRSESLETLANKFSAWRITSRAINQKSRSLISSLKSYLYRWNQLDENSSPHVASQLGCANPHPRTTYSLRKAGIATESGTKPAPFTACCIPPLDRLRARHGCASPHPRPLYSLRKAAPGTESGTKSPPFTPASRSASG